MQEILSKKMLGERIKSLRLEKAYAQADVASFLKLSRSNYSQIELGNQYPTFRTLNVLSRHYNKSYEWLLHGKDIQQEQPVNSSLATVLKELESHLNSFSQSLKKLEDELQSIKNKIEVAENINIKRKRPV